MGDGSLSSDPEEQGASSTDRNQAMPTLLEDFEHDWYIRVKFQFYFKRVDRAAAIAKMDNEMVALLQGLRTALAAHNVELWPERLVDAADEANDERCTCYWVLGLPTIPPSDLATSKQLLREWQGKLAHGTSDQNSPPKNKVQARFMPRKALLQQTLLPSGDENLPKEVRRSRESFKKVPGSNPQQVRRQFLKHVMGSDGTQVKSHEPSVKLRPAKDVIKKLKYDPSYDPDDYVVGYIDRKAGILEKSISSWENFDQEDLIAHFRQVSEDRIVWDRSKKIDRLFAS
ncbi:hypothetical protein V1515DRAFT_597722 [Lipomyces mesembrius]